MNLQGRILEQAEQGANRLGLTLEEFIYEAIQDKCAVETSLPSSFKITEEMRTWFSEKGFRFDVDKVTERWMLLMRSNTRKNLSTNWVKTWENAMLKFADKQPTSYVKDNPVKGANVAAYKPHKRHKQTDEEKQRNRQLSDSAHKHYMKSFKSMLPSLKVTT